MITLPVVFISDGQPLVGVFYRNTDSLEERQAAVIITGSWLTVKEQMPATYAEQIAEIGYTAFIFDFAGFGESAGAPAQTEIPTRKITNIIDAADFVSTMSFVQPGAIGHLAICASAQYALAALVRDVRIRSFVSVAGWYHDAASIVPFYGGHEGVAKRIAAAKAALHAFSASGEVVTVPAYEVGNEEAGMFFELDYYARADRGAVSAWKNEMSPMSWLYWLTFDGLQAASQVRTPSLFVHGDGCVLPQNARSVFDQLPAQKQMIWTAGSQTDFYDQKSFVAKAVAGAHEHFARTLNA